MLIPARPESLAYRTHSLLHSVWQRRNRTEAERLFQRAIATLDQRAFTERFRPYWTPFPTPGPAKYLDLHTWLRQAAHRFILAGLPAGPPGRRVLDLGAGAGYFPLLCRQEGHHPVTLDLDDEPLYRELIHFFGLPRVIHRIEPMQPLPRPGERYDLITAFRMSFNIKPDGSAWNADEWAFLMDDVRGRLTDGGAVVLCFNLNPSTGEFYSRPVAKLLGQLPGFSCRLFFEYAFLRKR
jgi:SAM-dependent methyltransferase